MYIVLAVLVLLFVGFTSFANDKNKLNKKVTFCVDFHDKFYDYASSTGRDHNAYGWLIHRSCKMQKQINEQGLIATYCAPYSHQQVTNYSIIINMIPALNHAFQDYLLRDDAKQYLNVINESLTRHRGYLDDKEEYILYRLKNPIYWFQRGINQVIGIPFYILSMFGIMNPQTASRIIASYVFGIISGVVSFISFLSAIFTLVIGWDDFLIKIQPLYNYIF